jgi:hypothetical protein
MIEKQNKYEQESKSLRGRDAPKKRTAVHLAQRLFVDPSFTHPVANANPNPDERIQPP